MQIYRFNQLLALTVDSEVVKDLNTNPHYIYDYQSNTIRQVLPEDSEVGGRNSSFSTGLNNTLLKPTPTPILADPYHANHEIGVLIADPTLPSMEFKRLRVNAVAGFGYSSDVVGIAIRAYCELSNGDRVELANVIDLNTGSNFSINSSDLVFETAIFSQGISFDIFDLDYLFNSEITEIQTIKTYLFGSDKPQNIFVETSFISPDQLDSYVIGIDTFDRFFMNNQSRIAIPVSPVDTELFNSIIESNDKSYLTISLQHSTYTLESYLTSQFASDGETFNISHDVQITEFDDLNVQIGVRFIRLSNSVSPFLAIDYRPVLSDNTDHATVTVRSIATNTTTGLQFTRYTTYLITDATNYFYTMASSINVDTIDAFNTINKEIKQIVNSNKQPQAIRINVPKYIFGSTSNDLVLLDEKFLFSVQLQNIENIQKIILKIDNKEFESINRTSNEVIFEVPGGIVPKRNRYYILDENLTTITYGTIIS